MLGVSEDAVDANEIVIISDSSCSSGSTSSDTDDSASVEADQESEAAQITSLSLRQKLQEWAVANRVSRSCGRHLLRILREEGFELPICLRTLLGTPRRQPLKEMCNGLYGHREMKRNVDKYAARTCHRPLKLEFCVDGVPLGKSTHKGWWVIFACVKEVVGAEPFLVGCWEGYKKPDVEQFLDQTMSEICDLEASGLVILDSVVSDSPARAFILRIAYPGGTYACPRCWVKGISIAIQKRGNIVAYKIVYPRRCGPARPRTHDEYMDQVQPECHHRGISPFSKSSLNMVSGFVFDYMHCICMGVSKKIVDLILSSLSGDKKDELNQRILDASSRLPWVEFPRGVRTMEDIVHFKAAEHRGFLLYLGPVVLKDLVDAGLYQNFLLLSLSIRTFCDPVRSKDVEWIEYGERLLNLFLDNCERLHGEQIMTFNFHILQHIPEDVRRFGCLDSNSCFKYENAFQRHLNLLRGRKDSLKQLLNRLSELDSVESEIHAVDDAGVRCPEDRQLKDKVPERRNYKGTFFSKAQPNNAVIVNGQPAIITSCYEEFFEYRTFAENDDFFNDCPNIDSRHFDIFVSHAPSQQPVRASYSQIECKCVMFSNCNKRIFFPLLHSKTVNK